MLLVLAPPYSSLRSPILPPPTTHLPALCAGLATCPELMPVSKAGRCPWVPAPLAPELCLEQSECSRDDQCRGNKKCCFSSCAMRCLDPDTGEPTLPWLQCPRGLPPIMLSH
uniref:WAP domain-containing protein n=1 Tax=Catagonus wagneri TaxID=51154 RepID=A0A8C3YBD1_9CETA